MHLFNASASAMPTKMNRSRRSGGFDIAKRGEYDENEAST